MDHIDLSKYFVEKDYKTGRPRCDAEKLLKVILFAFMEQGICSLREIEKLCRTDIRFIYLLDEMPAPSHATFGNFIRNELTFTVEELFKDINNYIFEADSVDLNHLYIDGTKLEANANRYTWVWKKSCMKNRDKVFDKVSILLDAINADISFQGICFEKREEYAVEYLQEILNSYGKIYNLNPSLFVTGSGHRKSREQRLYQELREYMNRPESVTNISPLLMLNPMLQIWIALFRLWRSLKLSMAFILNIRLLMPVMVLIITIFSVKNVESRST